MRAQSSKRDIFTTTNDRLRRGQLLELFTQRERLIQQLRKPAMLLANRKQVTRVIMFTRGCESGNLAFDKRQLQPADAGCFARAVNLRQRSLLKLIHSHTTILNYTSQQLRQLNIGHKVKPARKVITRYLPTLPVSKPVAKPVAKQGHALELLRSMRRQHPAPIQIPNALPFHL